MGGPGRRGLVIAGGALGTSVVRRGEVPRVNLAVRSWTGSGSIVVEAVKTRLVGADGVVSFALPRTEVGQGVTTSTAMLIAEELDVPLERVRVTLADARPELLFNQLTGGSNTTIATYLPMRVAAATARSRLLDAAAGVLGAPAAALVLSGGLVTASSGRRVGIGELSAVAAADRTARVAVTLKPDEDFRVIGTPRTRVDALDAVTGRKRFTMDLDAPGAKPTTVCRPPTTNGRVSTVDNVAQVRAMPGVTDVAAVSTGVAVRAQTFGQCVDAVRALRVTWRPDPVGARSEAAVLAAVACAYARATGTDPTVFPINHGALSFTPKPTRATRARAARRRRRVTPCPEETPCPSHLNGRAVTPCSVPVGALGPEDEVTTIEGLAGEGGLHPMQRAWLDLDVSQCGYCQPGQIMAAVALVRRVAAEGRAVTDADLDGIRNVCRCGAYPRIREAIRAGGEAMRDSPDQGFPTG